MQDHDTVLMNVDRGIALITLNRPEHGNAWNPDMRSALFARLDQAARDPDVRALVLTGAGASFCVGGDGAALGGIATDGALAPSARPYWFTASIAKPIIAAINGACFGVGLQQALCCDVRIGADDAKFSTAFARRALAAESGMSWLLPRIVGMGHALDLLLSARLVRAGDALQMGLLNRIAPAGDLITEAMTYARMLVDHCSPSAMREIKQQCYADQTDTLPRAYERAEVLLQEAVASADFKEGVNSWREKRAPAFAPLSPDRALIDPYPPKD